MLHLIPRSLLAMSVCTEEEHLWVGLVLLGVCSGLLSAVLSVHLLCSLLMLLHPGFSLISFIWFVILPRYMSTLGLL